MSDRVTRVTGPSGAGLDLWGRATRAGAIAEYRKHYARELAQAAAALDASDDELIVETFLGPYAQKNRETVP